MKPINGSWLFNVDFEEIDTALTYAKFEKNKVTKQPELESVIKNKFLQKITMETKFKRGEWVKITKPENTTDINVGIIWIDEMDVFNEQIKQIVKIQPWRNSNIYYLKGCEEHFFEESWLSKVNGGELGISKYLESIIQRWEQERQYLPLYIQNPQIDWEARRWEMASKIFAETEDITLDSAVRQADIFIEYYKRTLKTINNT